MKTTLRVLLLFLAALVLDGCAAVQSVRLCGPAGLRPGRECACAPVPTAEGLALRCKAVKADGKV